MRQLISYISLEKLHGHPGGLPLVRLMLAVNDIATVNEYIRRLQHEMPLVWGRTPTDEELEGLPRLKQKALQGHVRYCGRMMVGHLAEAARIITDIEESQELAVDLRFFDAQPRSRARHDLLKEQLGSEKFDTHVRKLRNNIGFHYNHHKGNKVLREAIKRRLEIGRTSGQWIFTQGEPDYNRIAIADDILDSATAHLMGVPPGEDFAEEFLDELKYHIELGTAFTDFAIDFLLFSLDRHAMFRY